MMLSRIAESLFWIGRYLERADDTSRILDVQLQVLLEDPGVELLVALASTRQQLFRAFPLRNLTHSPLHVNRADLVGAGSVAAHAGIGRKRIAFAACIAFATTRLAHDQGGAARADGERQPVLSRAEQRVQLRRELA